MSALGLRFGRPGGGLLVLLLACAGCSREAAQSGSHAGHAHGDHDHDHGHEHEHAGQPASGDKAAAAAAAQADHGHGGHHHKPQHGGVLIPLGSHFANLELVLDSARGALNLYVLDGCAEHGVQIAQPAVEVTIKSIDERALQAPIVVSLEAQASSLSGEAVGNSSRFSAVMEELVGAKSVAVEIRSIEVKGSQFRSLATRYPGE